MVPGVKYSDEPLPLSSYRWTQEFEKHEPREAYVLPDV